MLASALSCVALYGYMTMCLADSKQQWQVLQKPGRAVALAVGGAEEALLSRPRTLDLVLKKRQGFVRIAVQAG